ncbi:hypothetical protein PVA45_07625 (plasmid) [Entomospira entomophila]|uniref:Uncharacterized protein n=1 Tax=Entomospira entomophila TaxID=2719988 RepID=A0A968G9W9_9SPIO|nr:hypothetical protein [Entomospira entomophilus]NIZ41270.1 hypothetical protein [Entomospira entomophilus]WDI36202.1 hypothetical protein PVA45_07625 [Entomospira entomophilus]
MSDQLMLLILISFFVVITVPTIYAIYLFVSLTKDEYALKDALSQYGLTISKPRDSSFGIFWTLRKEDKILAKQLLGEHPHLEHLNQRFNRKLKRVYIILTITGISFGIFLRIIFQCT